MTDKFVAQHVWSRTGSASLPGIRGVGLVADVSGRVAAIEEAERDDVLEIAASFRRHVSFLTPNAESSCYLQGDPNPFAHPDHPDAIGAYAFSCTTFVQHCYAPVVRLVEQSSIPLISQTGRSFLESSLGLRTQAAPFRRLTCGYLICAFEQEPQRFPFRPEDDKWAACDDATTFGRLLSIPPLPPLVASGTPAGDRAARRGGPLLSRLAAVRDFLLRALRRML